MELLLIGVAVGVIFWIVRFVTRTFLVKQKPSSEPVAVSYGSVAAPSPHPQSSREPSRRSKKVWFGVVAALILLGFGIASYVYVQTAAPPDQVMHTVPSKPTGVGNVQSKSASGYFVASFYFLVMLAGMAGEYMFGLKNLKQFTMAEFVRPFWVSLIVFSVPWSEVDKSALTFASVLACYQNGFFWKKVLERKN